MAATDTALRSARWLRGFMARWRTRTPRALRAAGLAALAAGTAQAVTLPEDKAEALYHLYDGGGTRAYGPALLVRKSLADRYSFSAFYNVDAVSNASIDVVTTASPYSERRTEYGLGLDYVYRDSLMSLSTTRSTEPDYEANSLGIDVSQDVFGGMTTVSLGFTRAWDKVGRSDVGFFDEALHWRYRLGVTQILTPRWVASLNAEAVSDSGFLGNPYRVARVFGAAVPERHPRTRTSRAIKGRLSGAIGSDAAVHAEYRYFWDTWDITAHTVEVGYSRYVREDTLVDGFLRYHSQSKALFYSDNATAETTYISRNRQLSTFTSPSVGVKLSYRAKRVPGQYEIKAHAAYEYKLYDFKDFTDLRNGRPYSYSANVFQVYLSATF